MQIRSLDLDLSLTQEISDIFACYLNYSSLEIAIVCLNMGQYAVYYLLDNIIIKYQLTGYPIFSDKAGLVMTK